MRISDWSSDVCSSDLRPVHRNTSRYAPVAHTSAAAQPARMSEGKCTPRYTRDRPTIGTNTAIAATTGQRQRVGQASRTSTAASVIEPIAWPLGKLKRSEEHTSELQSLMRISYAGYCLKK